LAAGEHFNDEFIEVRDGLIPGENVAIYLPKKTDLDAPLPPQPPNAPIRPKRKTTPSRSNAGRNASEKDCSA
jgi:hypothetical protein